LLSSKPRKLKAIDLFAGGGGSSIGASKAGVRVVAAFDRWSVAKQAYEDNFPGVRFYQRNIERVSPRQIKEEIGVVDLLIASPECTSHTCAKGNARRSDASRNTAFQVIRFARVFRPRWIVVENVVHMRSWDRYTKWKRKLESLGYHLSEQVLNASTFGVPQSRRRLFVICDSCGIPPAVTPDRRTKTKKARDILNTNGQYKFTNLRKHNRAKPTLERAKRAMSVLGKKSSFLLVYYGTDGAGGWQTLQSPLRTITTLDRFALVKPDGQGHHKMRMLQVEELKKAMGFPGHYLLNGNTRRDQIKLLGNAVCPPVMRAVVKTLLRSPAKPKLTTQERLSKPNAKS
jgi:DNA (cytosine-5)-methyltransferase 1